MEIAGIHHRNEEALFYQGYGQANIDHNAIAYYRYDRVLNDMTEDCKLIFSSDAGGEDRKKALEDIKSMFLPNGKIEMPYRADKTLKAS